ncbi:lactate utilization protein [Campylobacter sp. JMF_04 NA10]|uniref:lactate utilization protein n=1 Tax=Campylobacter sp. JMF_04 NA10 TaxID=2983824 RepID=UPI0022E9BA2A|nr:lactate utilization protein [Campylobacter sp. JMF_04 NA10]MDA3076228.1 lactate utilization protein [Campylobacter sp. JMF_04 NA10]
MNFDKITKNLEKLGYKVSVFESKEKAVEYLNIYIHDVSVGFGGSMSVKEMGLYESLREHNETYWHWLLDKNLSVDETRKKALTTDVYISSVNGISEDGEIINIDGTGNRIAAICYGHKKVYFIVGKNKIAPDFDSAMSRARNIAAVKNTNRFKSKTPCVANGDKCYDCKSKERMCRGFSIFYYPPYGCEYEVILINENLGF